YSSWNMVIVNVVAYILRVGFFTTQQMVSKNWLVQKQTAPGKDISNPLMADNLPKIVWIFECWSYHHTTNGHQFTMSNPHQELTSPEENGFCKELASPKQIALGKDNSNLLIVDSLVQTIWLSMYHVIAIKHWLFQSKRLLVKKT
nr:hypothetical protein [Tanacetum cinerariifolium]